MIDPRKERLSEYVGTVRKFHSYDELRRRFSHGTMDETFHELGTMADPMLDANHATWLGYEILTDSRFLDREYLDQDVINRVL